MQTVLLKEIELDIKELKFLLDAIEREPSTPLREVALRRILQMKKSLDQLSDNLNPEIQEDPVMHPMQKKTETELENIQDLSIITQTETFNYSEVLGEKMKTSDDLLQSVSINDSFRFSRELFDGDTLRMNSVLRKIGEMESSKAALSYLQENESLNTDSESYVEFAEIVDKYFSTK